MKVWYLITVIFFLISCSKSDYKQIISQDDQEDPILIKGVNIFNGRDQEVLIEKDLLIKNGLIHTISDNLKSQEGYIVINAKGKTLMPGLIDAHVHLSGSGAVPWENVRADIEYNLQAYLYCGITTVYDLGGLAGELSSTAEKVEKGELIGPSIYNTHIPITVENGHPIPLTEIMLPWPIKSMVNVLSPTIESANEASDIIKSYVSNDIDYVKIICDQIPPGSPEMKFDQLKSLIDEAHKAKQKVFVHIGSPQNAIDAIKAGADVLAHGVWRGELNSEQASFIAQSKIPIIYTVSGFKNVACIHRASFHPSELDRKLVSRRILDPVTSERGGDVHTQKVMNAFFENVANQEIHWQKNFEMLYEKGAIILPGTDSNLPGTYAGTTYYQELDELKKMGMSNFEILHGATYLNSRLFMEDPDFGILEEGKKADLLLLTSNPLEDLSSIKEPEVIIKNGRIVERLN